MGALADRLDSSTGLLVPVDSMAPALKHTNRNEDGKAKGIGHADEANLTNSDVKSKTMKTRPSRLHEEIVAFAAQLTPTAAEHERCDGIIELVRKTCYEIFGTRAQVEPFGSFVNGLATSSSDVDLVICGLLNPDSPGVFFGNKQLLAGQHLRKLKDKLQECPKLHIVDTQLIQHAKIPLLKFTTEDGVMVDLSINDDSGPKAARYILEKVRQYPPLRPLALVLKAFLKAYHLADVKDGGLGGFAQANLLVAHIQETMKAGQPTSDFGELLVTFFDRYANLFNPALQAVSVRMGGIVARYWVENRMHYSAGRRGGPRHGKTIRTVGNTFSPMLGELWVVENPITALDVAQGSFNIYIVRELFGWACWALKAVMPGRGGQKGSPGVSPLGLLFNRTTNPEDASAPHHTPRPSTQFLTPPSSGGRDGSPLPIASFANSAMVPTGVVPRPVGRPAGAPHSRRPLRPEATLSPLDAKPANPKALPGGQGAAQPRRRVPAGSHEPAAILVVKPGTGHLGSATPGGAVQGGPSAASLVAIDRALGSGNAALCWEIVQRLNSMVQAADGSNPAKETADAPQASDCALRSRSQLVTSDPGPGPSSLGNVIEGYDWDIDILGGKEDGKDRSTDWVQGGEKMGSQLAQQPARAYGHLGRAHGQSAAEPVVDGVCAPDVGIDDGQRSVADLLGRRHRRLLRLFLHSQCRDIAIEYTKLLLPCGKVFTAALRELLQFGDADAVLSVLNSCEEDGAALDQYAFSTKLSALGRLGLLDDARQAFNRDLEVRSSLYIFNSMMDAYARVGDNESLQELKCLMSDRGISPDAITYTSLIRSMGMVGKMEDVKLLVQEMLAAGLRPTPHTFTVVFKAAERNRNADADWLMALPDIMADHGIQMNQQILGAMIAACSWADLGPDQIQTIFDWVEDLRQRSRCGDMVYNSLLLLCARRGLSERVMDVWDALHDDRVHPNGHLFSAALSACISGQAVPSLMNFAARVAQELMHEWRTVKSRTSTKSRETASFLGAFNSLINVHVWLGNLDEALDLYNRMRHQGPMPDEITYNTLMSAFANTGRVKRSMELLVDMQEDGLKPTVRTYGTLLNACAKALEVGRAQKLFKHMQAAGVPPSVECYTSLIDACVKEGSPASLETAFVEFGAMKAAGLRPTAVTYGCLLVGCEKMRDTDHAFLLYREASDAGVLPTDEFHNTLVNMCTRADRLDEALELVKSLARNHGAIELHTLNSLVRALCDNFTERAVAVLRLMRNREMLPSRDTYLSLVTACARDGNWGLAIQLWREMQTRGMEVDRVAGSMLVMSLCRAGELATALQVADDMLTASAMPSLRKGMDVEHLGDVEPDRVVHRHACLPDALALGSLAHALAQNSEPMAALRAFNQIRRQEGDAGLCTLVSRSRHVFESLIEACCRKGLTESALEVFDEWKAAAAMVMAQNRVQGGEEWAYKRCTRWGIMALLVPLIQLVPVTTRPISPSPYWGFIAPVCGGYTTLQYVAIGSREHILCAVVAVSILYKNSG
ncbi:unnamed protein product [Ostreobium quekettii]|uniref:Uncharacterized protein n=1 Tax=Ostreobium quekettii TaxID=121088 RepID=A0A8S1JC52_9CHLO|nr:unnamed protein product [Ostreobium quekettii]